MDFLPMPHSVRKGEGFFVLRYDTRIVLENTEPSAFLYAQMLQADVQRFTGLKPAILRGTAQPGDVILRADAALEETRLPVVAVGTELVLQERISTVLNDDVKMGDNMARALGNRLQEGDTVLLLTDSAESLSGETELRQRLEQMGVTVQGRIFCGDSRDWAYRQTLQQLYLLPDLDAIVVFSAKATVGAAAAVKYLRRDVAIVGTDVVTELIECIEDGTVSATIVRNSFGMGYLGVEYAAEALRGNAVPDERTLASVVVTQDNLFTAEIEKIVFPYE